MARVEITLQQAELVAAWRNILLKRWDVCAEELGLSTKALKAQMKEYDLYLEVYDPSFKVCPWSETKESKKERRDG